MYIKTTVLVPMDPGLARTAVVIHGCYKMNRRQPAPATTIVRTRAFAARRKAKPFTPAVTAIAMAHGNSIPPASIGAPGLVETAAHRPMIMTRTV